MKQKRVLSTIFAYLITFIFLISSAYGAQPAVDLGTAGNFVVLAKSGISTTGTTSIVGNIGVSPVSSTAITGFGLIMDSTNRFSTSSLVTGKAYAADYTSPTPTKMTTAVSDMETAYTDAAGRALPDQIDLGAGEIGGMTLVPGLYKWGTGVTISTDVTLAGNSNAVWIFQISGDLSIASAKRVILSGGAQAKNIFWQVAGTTTLGTTSVFNGVILGGPGASTIALRTGATLNGRALAQKDVTLDANKVSLSNGNTIPQNPATLTVTKIVINDDGGNKTVKDFVLKVDDKTVNSSQQFIFNPGIYQVSETKDKNYKASFSGDCSSSGRVTLKKGDVKNCIITNNDIKPYNPNAQLTVIKKIINDDGGNKTVSEFILKVGSLQVISGVQNTFSAGMYTVSETKDKNYKASFGGDCSSSGRVTLKAGDVKVCVITNNDIKPYNYTCDHK
jgi:hypothetical protein